jgi:hypothetical protein
MYFPIATRLLEAMGNELPEDDLGAAIALGWRVAELYSLVDDPGKCSDDTLLPVHSSLAPADQLELQLGTAVGFAKRAGVECHPAELEALTRISRKRAEDSSRHQAFRDALRAWHVKINKDLWSRSEALGRAYELGNGLSDTYGRISRAYRENQADLAQVWREVFARERIERLKKLLDDLHCRLDPTAATVVREQLDAWCDEVPSRLHAGDFPDENTFREPLRRQTVIWRQLVAGDKDPEAYLGDAQRANVRDTLRGLVWQRYRRLVPILAAILTIAAIGLPPALAFYQDSIVPSGLTSLVVATIGALGITRASIILTVRSRVQSWADLLWQRAIVAEVSQATLTVQEVFAKPPEPSRPRIIVASTRAAGKLRSSVTPARPAREGET